MQSMISYYDYKLFIFENKNDTLKLVKKNKNILMLASTFPLSENDPVPSFVRDQIELIKYFYPNLNFFVVSPSNNRLSDDEKLTLIGYANPRPKKISTSPKPSSEKLSE